MVSHLCSNDSSVLLRCPTPRRRTRGACGYCLFPPACRMVPLQASPRSPGSRAWSFQTCVGSTTTQDRPKARDIAPGHIAFRFDDSVGVPIAIFRSSIPSPTVPLFTLRQASRDTWCKTRGRADRYSFLVRLFHPLLHAGLARRTNIAIAQDDQQSKRANSYQELTICTSKRLFTTVFDEFATHGGERG